MKMALSKKKWITAGGGTGTPALIQKSKKGAPATHFAFQRTLFFLGHPVQNDFCRVILTLSMTADDSQLPLSIVMKGCDNLKGSSTKKISIA